VIEVGWRFARHAWGQGYATEAARAALRVAFDVLDFPQVVAFTTVANQRSAAVMQRLGMREDAPFDHPALPVGHPQRRHRLFRITACS
jgi:RimJ/RimL family protein N-acetyltransferase